MVIAVAVVNSILQASMQAAVPMNMRGKVFGFRRTLSSSLIPLGMTFILFFILEFSEPVNKLINFDIKAV